MSSRHGGTNRQTPGVLDWLGCQPQVPVCVALERLLTEKLERRMAPLENLTRDWQRM